LTASTGVGENDRLAAVAFRGFLVEGAFNEFVFESELFLAVGEGDVAFDGDRSLLELDESGVESTG